MLLQRSSRTRTPNGTEAIPPPVGAPPLLSSLFISVYRAQLYTKFISRTTRVTLSSSISSSMLDMVDVEKKQ
jgi:hypothetical protein